MKTIQITIDDELLSHVDQAIRQVHMTRSAFIRAALEQALKALVERRLEEKHRAGYRKKPVHSDEVADWEDEQAWGDE